ncbi:DUF7283 family protein [Halolamina litorea]|uniref:META domain-containing protein n=1 Tax=Halolamina litorea TaxID=1515593 RepID=A0ABD6BNF2_9EURY|nr:hypothetical protein [Halolamina litorea]
MLSFPTDSPALHAGLVLAAVAFIAVAGSLPARPAPDAGGVADTVDRVAVAEAPSITTHGHAADSVRLRPDGIALRNEGGTAHATFAFGPIVPVRDGPLRAVLAGTAPQTAFSDRDAFIAAVEAARNRDPRWVASEKITVTGVSWDGERFTLVGV